MPNKRKVIWCRWIIAGTISLLMSAELAARFILGLGEPPLYERSSEYGYRAIPNQDIRRFGNHIFYNAQGLRTEPISTKPSPGTIRILCLGDSITFGGVETDQVKTYPYQLQEILNRTGSKRFEVLNASTGNWALGNEEAYLRKEGIYSSQIVVLEHRTGNLFRAQSSGDIVGQHPSFPNHKPLLALEEGLFRYFLPRYLPSLQTAQEPQLPARVQTGPSKRDLESNLASLERIAKLVRVQKARLIVFLIEQPDEFEPKDALTQLGKKELAKKAKELNITYADITSDFQKAGGKKLFRDEQDMIHPNPAGNTVMAKAVARLIQSSF